MEKLIDELKQLEQHVCSEQASHPQMWREHPGFKEIRNHLADAKTVMQLLGAAIKIRERVNMSIGQPVAFVQLKSSMMFTRYVFGPLSEIEGKRLRVLERNDVGDCLCLIDDEKGERLVDVDYRDIKP